MITTIITIQIVVVTVIINITLARPKGQTYMMVMKPSCECFVQGKPNETVFFINQPKGGNHYDRQPEIGLTTQRFDVYLQALTSLCCSLFRQSKAVDFRNFPPFI